jgi:putative N6-adenine-specific DNA methylase
MKAFAVTNKGTEAVCKQEIAELIGAKGTESERIVSFEAKSYEQLCKLTYLGQSMTRVCLLLGHFAFTDDFFDKLEMQTRKSELGNWLKGITYKAECQRFGEHDFGSIDAEQKMGEICHEDFPEAKVSLKNPDMTIFIFITSNECHFGIDFSGFDLGNRDYKIFAHRDSLNGPIAYSLVRISGWDGKQLLLDPFCGGGTIPIEAAFWQTNFSLNHYRKSKLAFTKMELGFDQKKFFDEIDKKAAFLDKATITGSDQLLAAVNASNKNAKIAGINKATNLTRIDIEWLDTKFAEDLVEFIVTDMPEMTKMSNKKYMQKVYDEFWFQVDFVMKKKGATIVAACNSTKEMAKDAAKFHFKLDKELEFWQGKEKMNISIFTR